VQVTNHTTYENTEVTNAQFKFVSVDERGSAIPLESVIRPKLPEYVEKLLKK